ncbi:MAG: hypothetical protein ACRDK0_00785 [Solirubrobacteraceae bacterium]
MAVVDVGERVEEDLRDGARIAGPHWSHAEVRRLAARGGDVEMGAGGGSAQGGGSWSRHREGRPGG